MTMINKLFAAIDRFLTQKEQIGQRESWKQERFFREWIPMENLYFDHFSIRETCDLIL